LFLNDPQIQNNQLISLRNALPQLTIYQ